jgi:hypothetical protein
MCKEDPRVVALGFEAVMSAAKVAFDRVKFVSEDLLGWKAAAWETEKKIAEADLGKFQQAFTTMMDYRSSILTVGKDIRNRGSNSRRNETRAANDQKSQLVELGVPSTLAEVLATLMKDKKGDSRFEAFSCAPYAADVLEKDTFTAPKCIRTVDCRLDTRWHAKMKAFGEGYSDQISLKVPQGIKRLEKDELSHGVVMLACYRQFTFDADETEIELFKLEANLPPLLFVQRAWAFSDCLENIPYAGMMGFLRVFTGYLIVMVVELASIVGAGYGLDSLTGYLETLSCNELTKFPTFGIRAGDSMFIPFGFVPLAIAVDKVDGDEYDYCGYAVQYLLDHRAPSVADKSVRAEIHAHLLRGIGRGGKVFHGENKRLLESWVANWQGQ